MNLEKIFKIGISIILLSIMWIMVWSLQKDSKRQRSRPYVIITEYAHYRAYNIDSLSVNPNRIGFFDSYTNSYDNDSIYIIISGNYIIKKMK